MAQIDKLAVLRAKSAQVNKAYGSEVVRKGVVTNIPRIPTGSTAADYVFGVNEAGSGGWAVGHGNCIVGWQSSGKTTLSLKACGNLQRMCVRCYRPAVDVKVERLLDGDGVLVLTEIGYNADGSPKMVPLYTVVGRCSCYKEGISNPGKMPEFKGNVGEKKAQKEVWDGYLAALVENSFEAANIVYGDVENTLDMKWARRHGVLAYAWDEEYKAWCPVAQFTHVVPSTAEQAIDVFDEYIRSGVVDLLVVDSVPALVPKEEVDASAEDLQRGVAARLVNKAFRRWVGSQSDVRSRNDDPREVTIIYVQQWRKGMGAFAENVMPAGNGQLFAYSIITEVYTKDKESQGDDALGGHSDKESTKGGVALRICVKNRKNKTFPPYKESSFRMLLVDDGGNKAGSIDDDEYLFKTALMLGIAEKNGSKYKFRGIDYSAQSAVVAEIANKPAIKAWLEIQIRKILYARTEGDS